MGKVQTSCRGSTKQAGRWTWTGCMRGRRAQKRLRPRKGIEGAQKKLGRPYGYQGNGGGQPRAQGLQTSAKATSPQTSSGTGHPGGIRESGQCNEAR